MQIPRSYCTEEFLRREFEGRICIALSFNSIVGQIWVLYQSVFNSKLNELKSHSRRALKVIILEPSRQRIAIIHINNLSNFSYFDIF